MHPCLSSESKLENFPPTESRQMEYKMNEINFPIFQAWVEGGIDVSDAMQKIKKCCEGVRTPPTPQKSDFFSFDIPSVETQSVFEKANFPSKMPRFYLSKSPMHVNSTLDTR